MKSSIAPLIGHLTMPDGRSLFCTDTVATVGPLGVVELPPHAIAIKPTETAARTVFGTAAAYQRVRRTDPA
jgi:hypothetical protein